MTHTMTPLRQILVIVTLLFSQTVLLAKPLVLVTPAAPSAPVAHGLTQLKSALTTRGLAFTETPTRPAASSDFIILTGVAADPIVPTEPESSVIQHRNASTLLLSGSDDRGTMYALLEASAQISAAPRNSNPLLAVTNSLERPFCRERSLSTYVFTGHVRGGIFHDVKYWDLLFTQLAATRINSYALIFKCPAPIYTMFFNVEGYTSEQTGGLVVPANEQARNLAALQRIAQQAHDRGIKLTIGIWNHVRNPEDADRLSAYSEAAIAKLIKLVPMDGLQLRMHWESGLPRDEATLDKFWGSVFDGIKNAGRPIRVYPRAKGLPDSVIDLAVAKGLDFAIETKYSAEQFGLPFHPAKIQPANQRDRRHGYADLLSHPKRNDILWRIWNSGTQKLLLWGDTDYARRWVDSTQLYGSGQFEITEIPGAQPMGAGNAHALTPAHVYTDYEFQRYWAHPLMFGRLGYNPATPDEVFAREFRARFGHQAGPLVQQALARASQIIPRLISSALTDFPEQRGVTEWGSGSGLNGKATLAAYAKVKPLDVQTFLSFEEAAALLASGGESARVWPQQNVTWLMDTAAAIRQGITQIEAASKSSPSKELAATLADMRILASMAEFHAARIPAALAYNLYLQQGQSRDALDRAIALDAQAIEVYRGAAAAAGDYYRTDLDLSTSDTGHWRDELALLEKAHAELKALPATGTAACPSLDYRDATDRTAPIVKSTPVLKALPHQPIEISARIIDPSGVKWARVLYRGLTQFQNYQTVEMIRDGDKFTATIPAAKVDEVTEFAAETGAKWDLMYLIEAMDTKKNGRIWPDFEETAPYVFVTLPHKLITETGGKVAPRGSDDLTPGGSDNARIFRIAEPTEGDIFDAGATITVKIERIRGQKEEVVALYLNGQRVNSAPTAPLTYTLTGLPNGAHKLQARLVSEGLVSWSIPVEILIGRTRYATPAR
jgi:hypothetical protein